MNLCKYHLYLCVFSVYVERPKKDIGQIDSTKWTYILNHQENGLNRQVTGVVIEVIVH